jgi:hypothetical protein
VITACPICYPGLFDGHVERSARIDFCVAHARAVLAAVLFGFGSGPARREMGVATQKHSRRGRAGSISTKGGN